MSTPTPLRQSTDHRFSGRIRNVSKDRYIDPEWLSREWRQVWKKTWQAAAPLSDLKRPGDFAVYDVGPESILITRGSDHSVRAFYNVCQHRGLRLVDARTGRAENFRCPYHSWRYDADGALVHAPAPEGFQAGLPCENVALAPVRCEVALGFAWISLDPELEPLVDYLQDLLPLMSHYRFEDMTLVQDQTVSLNCNWKAVHDNFSELYHVHYLHPQHRRFSDCTGATSECFPRGHTRVWVPAGTTDSLFATPDEPTDIQTQQLHALGLDPEDFCGRVNEVQGAIRSAKRSLEAEHTYYANFSDEELSDVIQTNVFPNGIFTYQPEMLWLIRIRPHAGDPDSCYLDKLSFERFPGEASKRFLEVTDEESSAGQGGDGRPLHDAFDYSDVIAGRKSMTDTIDQDLSLLAHAQRGMHSEGFSGSWLNEIECRVSHFHARLDEMMEAP
jgi:phenylpropionate dioxygenase-like ring-hydroxylating dioxygenase large terminal subunit